LWDAKFVCRRDATIDGEVLTGAFLCTGNVKLTCANKHRGYLGGVLICDGDLEVPQILDSLVIARGRVICNDVRDSIVVQGRSKALGIRFFELSDAGIEVFTDRGGHEELQVFIDKLLERHAFVRSGFQLGDRLVSVNGKAIESIEQLRRILRQHYVDNSIEPQALPFVVERSGKTMALKLSYQ
jgi:S1-C subfamily serine protease